MSDKSIEKRLNIPFVEGVNSLVGFNISKKTEFYHAENARSKQIGTIEKREGQTVLGLTENDETFITDANYGLFPFDTSVSDGLYRISVNENPTLSINVEDTISIFDTPKIGNTKMLNTPLSISVTDSLNMTDIFNENTGNLATIYYINSDKQWIPLTGSGTNIPGGVFSHTHAKNNLFLVNLNSENRYIKPDGITAVDSTDGTGHLFNSPKASKINFYKDRLYLSDYYYEGNRYRTSILRSSYPMGIISLVSGDQSSLTSGDTIELTDTKYFYTDTGANKYDIYRGGTLIKEITVTSIDESSVDATWAGGAISLLSSDEVWIKGTYSGEKVFRWINNSSTMGQDVKRYDTFKLSGGENDSVTMMTNIGNVMMIANKTTMASWDDYILQNFDLDIGNVSKKGYVKIWGTLYFMHYTGVYATSGGVPRLMSNKIEKYITGATKSGLESCAAGKKGKSVFFTIGDVTLYNSDGSTWKTLSDVCLEFNLIQENWFVHTNVKASEFATFVESSDVDRLEFIDTAGNKAVKEFLSGETDDGTEINFRVDTTKLTPEPKSFDYNIKPTTLVVETERGSAMQSYVNLGDGYYPLKGKITKGLSVIKINNKDDERGEPPVCRTLNISFRDSSKQLCKLSRMDLIYLPSTEREFNNNE